MHAMVEEENVTPLSEEQHFEVVSMINQLFNGQFQNVFLPGPQHDEIRRVYELFLQQAHIGQPINPNSRPVHRVENFTFSHSVHGHGRYLRLFNNNAQTMQANMVEIKFIYISSLSHTTSQRLSCSINFEQGQLRVIQHIITLFNITQDQVNQRRRLKALILYSLSLERIQNHNLTEENYMNLFQEFEFISQESMYLFREFIFTSRRFLRFAIRNLSPAVINNARQESALSNTESLSWPRLIKKKAAAHRFSLVINYYSTLYTSFVPPNQGHVYKTIKICPLPLKSCFKFIHFDGRAMWDSILKDPIIGPDHEPQNLRSNINNPGLDGFTYANCEKPKTLFSTIFYLKKFNWSRAVMGEGEPKLVAKSQGRRFEIGPITFCTNGYEIQFTVKVGRQEDKRRIPTTTELKMTPRNPDYGNNQF